MVPKGKGQAFVDAAKAAYEKMYPSMKTNKDHTALIHERQFNRLVGLVEEARVEVAERRLPPRVVRLRHALLLIRRLALERVDTIARALGERVRVAPHIRVESRRRYVLAIWLLGANHREERIELT